MDYTEDEIERAARAAFYERTDLAQWHWPGDEPRKWKSPGGGMFDSNPLPQSTMDMTVLQAKAALSSVPRVPEGKWLAPDEPSDEMLGAGDSMMPQFAHKGYPAGVDAAGDVYRAMRDAAKASERGE